MLECAGTLCKSAETLKEMGAKSVSACATHALFNGSALERIEASVMEHVIVSDSIPMKPNACAKIKVSLSLLSLTLSLSFSFSFSLSLLMEHVIVSDSITMKAKACAKIKVEMSLCMCWCVCADRKKTDRQIDSSDTSRCMHAQKQ